MGVDGSTEEELRIVVIPYMAPGHMMPLVDIARLFAAHGFKVTIVSTPMNTRRFRNAIERAIRAGNQISVEIVPFPSVESTGLPQGCENLIDTSTPEMTIKLFQAIDMLQPHIEKLIKEISPHCIASDVLFPWTVDVATELGIPRLTFSGSGFFNLSVTHCLEHHHPHSDIESETEPFILPNFPDQVLLTKSQLPDISKTKTKFSELFDKLKEAERKSFGMLVNSFYELEPAYADYYRNAVGMKAWHVGPVSLVNREEADKSERGEKACVSQHDCIQWLDSKKPNSVIYICLGSLTRFSKAQLTELATSLENTVHFFVWVVGKVLESNRNGEDQQEDGRWLPSGFEDRVKESGKGMVIRGWAPQVLILEHPAIGAFMTHCGWNSILEGATAGVPMITWPIFAEQFYNEKLVTQVLKFGIPVGNEVWKAWATEETSFVSRENITKAFSKAMDDGEKTKQMRKKAMQLSQLAKAAVQEDGSSSKELRELMIKIKLYVLK